MHNSSAPETYEVMLIYRNEIIRTSISADLYMHFRIAVETWRSRKGGNDSASSLALKTEFPRRVGPGIVKFLRNCYCTCRSSGHESQDTHSRAVGSNWTGIDEKRYRTTCPGLRTRRSKSTYLPEIIRENVKISRLLRAYVSRPSL